MVGRSEVVQALVEQLPRQRLVTIVGPGGIGKTTVAVAVADRLLGSFKDGVCFVDLAALSDPLLVPSALAAQLGVAIRSDNPLPSLIAFLKEREFLIVLDSCEQMVEAAAALAEDVVKRAKNVSVLATSREPLRAEGERVHRLPPLTAPPTGAGLTAAEALRFPSVQLFVERAATSLDAFDLSDADAPVVAEICSRLDGIALAIEIAAGRVDTFGIAGLAAALNDRFQLAMRGRRTALPRHRTLGAALEWSHAQLPEVERLVLRRLAVFVGAFTMESAGAVLADEGLPVAEAVDAIANLITKSLVSADVDRTIALYRLFDVTRAYALQRLEESGERDRLARLHAEHFCSVLEQAQLDWGRQPAAVWLEQRRHLVDNVRAALDWAFSPSGDAALGAALTLAAVPLWFALSLTSECAERIDRALAVPAGSESADREMRLDAAHAWSLMQTRGQVPETEAAWRRVLQIAEQKGDVDYQLRAMWGLWAALLNRCELRPALAMAQRFSALAARQADGADLLVGDRMVGYIHHLMGEQTQARQYIERMLSRYEVPVIGAQVIRYVFDQRATAQCFLARILWLQGSADSALSLVKSVVDAAQAGDDVLSLCQVLVQAACPVALLVGDLPLAERYVTMLTESAGRQSLDFWQAFGHCFQSILFVRRGEVARGLAGLGAGLEELRAIRYGVYYVVFLGEYADAQRRIGKVAEGLAAIDAAIGRCEQNEERWYLPELLRIKGELIGQQPASDAPSRAEECFRESIRWARQQQTLAWELRTATSLARWLDASGNGLEARECLLPVYGRFDEGFETADLRTAKTLLDALGS
jgi:predicted ATPase